MKKVLCLARLYRFCCFCFYLRVDCNAFAQEEKGRMAVNVHAGISTTAGAQGLAGVEFRVAVADKWRLAPQFNIGGGHDLKFFDVTVDAHYVFNYENSNFSFYPIMGLGFDHYWQKYAGYKSTANRIFLDLGIGGEYAINDFLSITADMSKGMLLVGCSYKF